MAPVAVFVDMMKQLTSKLTANAILFVSKTTKNQIRNNCLNGVILQ